MKKLFSLLLLCVCNTHAVDLQKASQELQKSYLEANEKLNKQQDAIFSERQSLLTEMDSQKNELKSLGSQNLNEEIAKVQKELEAITLEIETFEQEIETFQSTVSEQRRQFETLLTQRENDQNQKTYQVWDQALEQKNYQDALSANFDLSKTIMADGFKSSFSRVKMAWSYLHLNMGTQ